MHYRIRALDRRQQVLSLRLEALDEADARAQAATLAVTPISVSQGRPGWSSRSSFNLPLFAQELHALVMAGLSVIESLEVLTEKTSSPETRAILTRLAQRLRGGDRLSSALAAQPGVFPALFTGIVQAAEGTSDLPRALGRYIDHQSRLAAVRDKVVSAAVYPTVLVIVGGAVSLFLLSYVVPRFAAVYQGSGRSLPWASQLLLSWGAFAGQHAGMLMAVFAVVGAGGAVWLRASLRDGGLVLALSWLPVARSRWRLFELSRLYLTLGMLLEGGIAATKALGLCSAIVSPASRAALLRVRASIEDGRLFSESLDSAGLSTPIAQRLLRVGERSGQLGTMLTRAANLHEAETTRWIERFTRLFEPVLMAAIGIVIGLIVILLYLPIFDLAGSLQ